MSNDAAWTHLDRETIKAGVEMAERNFRSGYDEGYSEGLWTCARLGTLATLLALAGAWWWTGRGHA